MTVFYHTNITFGHRSYANLVKDHFNDLGSGADFYHNIALAFSYNCFHPRDGVWSHPWNTKIIPEHVMPQYDPNFNKSFNEVTDQRALEIGQLINDTGKKVTLFYSGGIDSTTCASAMIKNLTKEQLSNFSIAMSSDSILENPIFYKNFIEGKINVIDSNKSTYVDLVNLDHVCITADLGDALFGTELGTKMYPQMKSLSNDLTTHSRSNLENILDKINDPEIHYSRYKDLLIRYFNRNLERNKKGRINGISLNFSDLDKKFGEMFYEKINLNIKTSRVPVNSLHDFFWWIIFNVKYMHCALRPVLIYSTGKDRKNMFTGSILNWYGSKDYQLWSMKNNNNGEKIRGISQGSYKHAAKKYVYDLDKNEHYFYNKIKIASMPVLVRRNYKKYFQDFDKLFGLTDQLDIAFIGDPTVDQIILDGLRAYKEDF